MTTLDQEQLKEILTYNPITGDFFWNPRPNNDIFNKRFANQYAGNINKSGYRTISVSGKTYSAARLAFLYQTGNIPKVVDHKNRNSGDDSWINLRGASIATNNRNKPIYKSKKRNKKRSLEQLFPGVCPTCSNKWSATVYENGRAIYLGSFDTYDEAKLARKIGAAKVYKEFSPHRIKSVEMTRYPDLMTKIHQKIDLSRNKSIEYQRQR